MPGNQPYVLFFPGGHCSAVSDCGWSFYTDRGLGVLSFSRPGYGATDVGDLTASEFAPLVREVCLDQGITNPVVVGVSFGGLQAMAVAGDHGVQAQRLVLHSCAPSTLPYPDSRAETLMGPVVFSPWVERITWALVRTDIGLGLMMAQLSRLPRRTLVELDSPSHLLWIGTGKEKAAQAIRQFLSR
ncbi:alpha/beta fold hydrolase [Paenarthrobacter sp. NPDC089989]|uniref:alpha/beta fold hydrolase n=1 Tax=unclassified Paenarthrobacter TaxID=2634190 RepID=UPI0037F4E998